jgi:O-antigen/teichoic acid export membrane protein
MLLFLVGTYLRNKLDAFFVGRIAGVSQMGSYSVASDLSAIATNEMVMPLGRALFPSYAKLAHDKVESGRAFEHVFAMLSIFCLPVGFGLAAVAQDMVAVILGAKWDQAVPVIRWLAVGALMTGLSHATGIFLSATGRARLNALALWVNLILLVPALWIGMTFWHVEGIAAARTISAVAFLVFLLLLLARGGALRVGSLCRALWRPVLGTAIMLAAVVPVTHLDISVAVLRLLLEVGIGMAAFIAAIATLWQLSGRPPGAEQSVLSAAGGIYAHIRQRRMLRQR